MAADLADQIDDYICSFEGVGDLTMDTLAMLIFAWAVLALFLIWLCKFLYNKYVRKIGPGDGSTAAISGNLLDTSKIGTSPSEKLRKSESKDVFTSKDLKGLDLAAKSSGKSMIKPSMIGLNGRSNSGIGGGGLTVPATPPVRKRLSRKSPGPELRKSNRIIPPPANVVGPETSSVTWTSQVFRWLYSDLVIVNELLHVWVQTINEHQKKSVEEQGIAVEIIRVLPESPVPTLSNIYCNSEEKTPSEMVITLDCDAMPVLQIKTFRQKSGKVETSHYKVTISRLRARLNIKLSYNTLKGEMKIDNYPDIRITMNTIGAIKSIDQDEKQLQEVISDIITNSIRECTYPIDFSIYSTCPRAIEMDPPEMPVILPIHYDSLAYNMEHLNGMYNQVGGTPIHAVPSGKRLLVKVVKGEGLTLANDPYCVVEMDEPPQKNQTGARQGMSPYWDEHFLFDLSPQSAEILFEVYDRSANDTANGIAASPDTSRFLGLGLVGIDELAVGPASSQILTLQPRPYETQLVSGAITVEFVFIEGAEVPAGGRRPYKFKEALKITNKSQINGVGGGGGGGGGYHQNGHDLADTAIKALEGGALNHTGNPSKSTLIIHSVQRNANRPYFYRVGLNENGQIEMNENDVNCVNDDDGTNGSGSTTKKVVDTENDTEILMASNNDDKLNNDIIIVDDGDDEGIQTNGIQQQESIVSTPGEPATPLNGLTSYNFDANQNQNTMNRSTLESNINAMSMVNNNSTESDRGRTRKKRDFFGTLKRRLGRSKSRTKSVDRGTPLFDPDNPTGEMRSVSADRLVTGPGGSVGGPRGANNSSITSTGKRLIVPTLDQSRRSSLSELSGISGFSSTSTKTFVHEASTLVLETMENGVKRHYLVPLAIAQKPRWRRKGTKLHIYNDHTFVAKHLSGGLLCDVCNKSIPRRPGKQGYECRDCFTKCHKQCHVRTPQACTNPTVLSMELSKINSAAADRSIRKT